MRKVIIVGATSGIGKGLAEKYIAGGCIVGITGRRKELLEEIKNSAPDRVFISVFDVTDRNAVEPSIEKLAWEMDGFDTFIYNAGYGKSSYGMDADMELRTVDVNATGFVMCACHAFDYFARNGIRGHIVATGSVASTKGLGSAPAYSATKRFISAFMEALEQKSSILGLDIRFTTVRPGFVDTDFISGRKYPFTISLDKTVDLYFRAVESGKRNVIIDCVWKTIVFFWSLIPGFLWVRMKIK